MTAVSRSAAERIEVAPSASAQIGISSGIRALMPFARPARGRFFLSAICASLAALAGIVPYWVIYRAVVELMKQQPDPGLLWRLTALALCSVVLRFVMAGAANWIAHLAAFDIQYGIRVALAEQLARMPLGRATARRSGELKKIMADDVERLELFLAHAVPDCVAALVTLVVLFGLMLAVDWRMAIALYALVIPAFAAIAYAMRGASTHMRAYKETQAGMNAAIVELIRGMAVVKTFNRDEAELRGTESMIRDYVAIVRRFSLEFLPFGTAFYVLLGANLLLLLPLGGWLWSEGSLASEEFLLFLIVGLGALAPISALLFLFSNLAQLASGGRLVAEILDESCLAEAQRSDAKPADANVRFRSVSFRYEDEWVLQDIDFAAAPGTLTALVGPSGAGKSTIAALLGRFWDPQRGQIELGGVPLPELAPDLLSAQVAMVLQETFLFDETIAENLRVGRREATQSELERAARQACVHDTITALPGGYDARVGEQGVRLSGGERQRLAIARALLADAPIVVLDEATAFVDPDNELALQRAVSELAQGRTVLMIAHRLSSIVGADQILVIDQGRIVERGRHATLLGAQGLYAQLWADFDAAEAIAPGGRFRE